MNRQESLFAILPRAVAAAKECKDTIYVIRCKIYVDEFDEGEHVYATKEAAAYVYPRWEQFGGELEASIDQQGSVFFAKVEDVLESIKRNAAKFSRIEVETDEEYLKRTFKNVTPEQATELLRGMDEEDKTWADYEKGGRDDS